MNVSFSWKRCHVTENIKWFCVYSLRLCSQSQVLSCIFTVCLRLYACLSGFSTLAFNTCMPASPQSLSAALYLHKTPLSSTGWKWSWLLLSPQKSTRPRSAGSIFQHSTWIIAALCVEGNVFFLPYPTLPPSLALQRPWQLTIEGHFFKVKMLTFTNRGGPQPTLLLTICVSPYGKDAFTPQIAWKAD